MKCDDVFDALIGGREGNYLLFDMAVCFLRGYDPEKLRFMLKSTDLGIVSDGLFIASEIGCLASNYVDDFRELVKSNDVYISNKVLEMLSIYDKG